MKITRLLISVATASLCAAAPLSAAAKVDTAPAQTGETARIPSDAPPTIQAALLLDTSKV